jgi:hypothetical protein
MTKIAAAAKLPLPPLEPVGVRYSRHSSRNFLEQTGGMLSGGGLYWLDPRAGQDGPLFIRTDGKRK